MNLRIILAALFCLSCISSSLWAQDIRFDLRLGTQVLSDQSIDFVSDENTVPTQTLRVSSELLPDTRFIVEYGLEAPQKVVRHAQIDARYLRQRFMAGADWGPTLFGFLRPFAGATVGYTLGFIELETSQVRYEDYSHDIIIDMYLGGEATIKIGRRWFITGGLRFGTRLQTLAEFDEATTERPEDDPWQRLDPELGTLNPNGWYVDFGAGFGIRF